MRRSSIWRDNAFNISFPKLLGEVEIEVVIIGGGITGLTAALQLTASGKKTAVIEAFEIGSGTTGLSSCHLTTQADAEYRNIASDFDENIASIVASSRKEAIDFIEKTVTKKEIDCDFRRLPGYWFSEIPEKTSVLMEELDAASRAGLAVNMTESIPLPFKTLKALKFENQAEFNSQQYLEGIADIISCQGGLIFENSPVVSLNEENGFYIIKTSLGTVKAKYLFVATQLPLFINILQSVSSPYISYVVAAQLKSSEFPVGLFWDTADPYHYIRYYKAEGKSYVVVGGEDHKTGNEPDTNKRIEALEKYVRSHFDIESIEYKWSAQYYHPADGLPYIGRSPFSSNSYLATGFSGDGLVYGTIAGIIVSDLILEKENKWLKAYDATRFTPVVSAVDFIKENVDTAKHFIKDRIVSEIDSISEINPGEGKIVKVDGEKLAVSRDENFNLHAVSPICSHLKCYVHWNSFEKSWDCPCHGSRFSAQGKVIYGPAVKNLEKKEIKLMRENN